MSVDAYFQQRVDAIVARLDAKGLPLPRLQRWAIAANGLTTILAAACFGVTLQAGRDASMLILFAVSFGVVLSLVAIRTQGPLWSQYGADAAGWTDSQVAEYRAAGLRMRENPMMKASRAFWSLCTVILAVWSFFPGVMQVFIIGLLFRVLAQFAGLYLDSAVPPRRG